MSTLLTDAGRRYYANKDKLAQLKADFDRASGELHTAMANDWAILKVAEHGMDAAKIQLAETVVYVSDTEQGGADWSGCITDAVHQLTIGKPLGAYKNLWKQYFGTKNYDRWTGQRSDHEYGYGPRHGSLVFSVGLSSAVRERDPQQLTPDETEAAIYYLLNIVKIQQARRYTP